MTVQPWVFFLLMLTLTALLVGFWFFVGQTPLWQMLVLTVRYRWCSLVDWLTTVGKSQRERFSLEIIRSYEEYFDTILVLKELDRFYGEGYGISYTETMAEQGDPPWDELADLFLNSNGFALSVISLYLFEERFKTDTDPEQIHDFLLQERRTIERDHHSVMDHPERLWRAFGQGEIRGWRTPITLPNS